MTGNQERFQQAMNQGHSAAWDQDWAKAAAYYRQALEEIPSHPKALTSLALALYEMQEYKEALNNYQQAALINPNDPVPLEKIAEILERMGNLNQAVKAYMSVAELYARSREIDKAIENWSSVVSLNPEHLAAHSRLALVYERMGRQQQAVMEYLAIASLLQNTGEVVKAIQTVNHALQIQPDSKEARLALNMLQAGKTLPKPRRPRGVTGPLVMEKVRQLEMPESGEKKHPQVDPIVEARQKALTMLADLLFEPTPETQSSQARMGLQSLVKGTGILGHNVDQTKILLHISQAIDLQSNGEDSLAIGELEHAIEAGLDTSAVYYDLGLLLSNTERVESAIRTLQHAVKHETFAMATRLLLGKTLSAMGRFKEAALEFLEAMRLADAESVSPEQAEEISQLYDPIIEVLSQQTDVKIHQRICSNISELLIRPDWREQMQAARRQLPPQPAGAPPIPLAEMLTEAGSSQVVESLARVNQLARENKLRTAMEEAFYAITFAPTYLPLHSCIGDLLVQENRINEAVQKYIVVARNYNVRGEANRAIVLLKRVSELAPMDMEARNNLIDLMIARGHTEETINEFLKLAETYYSLADLSMAHKTYSRALRYAQQANVPRDTKVKILHRMADIDLQSLDWRNALRVFEQIRTLQPDDEKAREMLVDLNLRLNQPSQALSELDNYLAHLMETTQADKALETVSNLVSEHPTQPALHRRLAEIYRQLGRTAEAIEQLDITGDLYLQTGNNAGATEAIMAILALNPPNAAQYQQVLAQLKATK
jgi:tetratricopeptide (TPR) repeat protein